MINYCYSLRPALLVLMLLALFSIPAKLLANSGCDANGVWLQVLGSGGPEILQDNRASSSYLVWLNGKARLLVDAGGGSALNFGRSGASFNDLDARARVKQLVLSHRMRRTLGREQQTRSIIKSEYPGVIAFADDLDCFRP